MSLHVVCLPPPEAADAIRRAWDLGHAVAVLDPSAPRAEVDRVRDRLDLEGDVSPDVAAIVVTSGTTGEPKGVELTFGGLQASARAVSGALGAGPGDKWLCCMPVHHVGGLSMIARSWTTGLPVEVLPRFDVEGVAASAASLVSFVPVMARRLMDAGVDLGRFRRILVGGGPVPMDLPGTPTYGLTESWGGVVHAGRPLDGVETTIGLDEEILLRGLVVMRGYRLPASEADTAAAAFTADGWLRTGDAGSIDQTGRLHVVGRLKEMIKTGGVSVAPAEVELVLVDHADVADVVVAGAPDSEWGERVVAYVVPSDPNAPPSLEELRSFARDRLSAPKLPRQVVVVGAIPRTPTGKVQRDRLDVGAPVRSQAMSENRAFGMPTCVD